MPACLFTLRNSKSMLSNRKAAVTFASCRRQKLATTLLATTLLLACTFMLSACGGSSSNSSTSQTGPLSGNWQFTMTSPDPNYPAGTQYALQGGFLVGSNGTVTGQALYSVAFDQLVNGLPVVCDSGSATLTGTVNGQTVTLTAVAGMETFQLTGTLSSNGSSIQNGQFTTTGGATVNSQLCGAPTASGTPGVWSAISVPPLTGAVTGTFHSFALENQEFPVTGTLLQGNNIGASSATVTGNLSFLNTTTMLTDYSCFSNGAVNVSGTISGNTVILQLVGTDGSEDGQIGVSAAGQAGSQLSPVTFDPVAPNGTYVLHSTGMGYQVSTKSCTDMGYICLALNNASPCQQPITLSPSPLIFSPQLLVCTTAICPTSELGSPTTQTITLTNNQSASASPLTNLSLVFTPNIQTDFTGVPDYSESDNCSSFLASSTSGQSCTITITYTPQESCAWNPSPGIAASCPGSLTALLTIQTSITNDNDTSFSVPVTGTGLSYLQPSVAEIDFGAEATGEVSQLQQLSFTNQSAYPVQIVGPASTPCTYSASALTPLYRPVTNDGAVGGLQVITATNGAVISVSGVPLPTIEYSCDADKTSGLPNFQISADSCTGALLSPQGTCSVEISYIPQPFTYQAGQPLDYFLELNTSECSQIDGVASDCEIDSGRFPVELKANAPSPLRLLPAAGLNFGAVTSRTTSSSQAVTLFNDPTDPNAGAVTFLGRFVVSGSYVESDDCPSSLASGSSCTINISFAPSSKGFSSGTLGIFYTLGSGVAGSPQYVYLRGTGQ
jgi:hypothetical protein